MKAQSSFKIVARVISTALLIILITAGMSRTVEAHENGGFVGRDKFKLSLGAFFVQRTSSTLRLDTTVGDAINIGTSLDWDRDLSGDTHVTVPRIDGYYRFSTKSRVDFSWFDISLKGGIELTKDIDFGDIHFPAGEVIRSEFDISTIKASYNYTLYGAQRSRLPSQQGLISPANHENAKYHQRYLRICQRHGPAASIRFHAGLQPQAEMASHQQV